MSKLAERLTTLSPQQRALLEMRLRERGVNSLRPQTIPRRGQYDSCPLSIDQERLWFVSRLEPDSTAYNLTSAVRIGGPLKFFVLKRTFDEVIKRHEILRTTFPARDGVPCQRIAAPFSLKIPRVDLRHLSATAQEEALQRIIGVEARRTFAVSEGPLLRAMMLEFSESEHVLITTLHHIVTDWWSFNLLWRELSLLYTAFSEGRPSPLAELPVQYADFALWQRQWLRDEVLASRLAYWKTQLAGAQFVLELPADRPRPPVQTYTGKRQYLEPPAQLWQRLKTLGRAEQTTLYMTLLAAFYTLLHRSTGQSDLIVGSPYANRSMLETQGMIGYLLNVLVLRADLSGDPTFRELLGRVREVTLGAYNNNDLPLASLLHELHLERDPSRNPLFQVSFVFTSSLGTGLERSELTLTPIEVDEGQARFDLTLGIRNGEDAPLVIFEYNTDLFDDATISRMSGRFQRLLEGIVANPQARLSDLPFIADTEHRPTARQAPPWRARSVHPFGAARGPSAAD
jgi:aspartate racemase